MSDKLLPCPFCGGPARVLGDDGKFYAICVGEDCYAAIGERYDRDAMPDHFYLNQEGAAAAWNTRSNPSHAQLATARSALEKAAAWLEGWASAEPYLSEIRSALSTIAQEPAGRSAAKPDASGVDREAILAKLKLDCVVTQSGQLAVSDAMDVITRVIALLPAGSASPGVTAPVALEALKAALIDACKTMRNARGAIESNQVVDKDVRGMLLKGQARINVALSAHPTVKVSGDAATDETAWLIELRSKAGVPTYHQLEHDNDWTADASRALRFARREDAQAYIEHIGWTEPKPVEHMWCAPRSRAAVSDGEIYAAVSKRISGDAAEMRERAAKLLDGRAAYCKQKSVEHEQDDALAEQWASAANETTDNAAAIRALPLTPEGRL